MSRPGRRSIFNVTTRNVNDHKLLEKPLSTEIDQNLRVLALFHPFSHELKAIYTEGMFTKSNPKAMFYVIHYLMMIYNSAYFHKKFRWPVVNKRDETEFRCSALAFFNECHLKFKWKCGPFKMAMFLFPGGVDFMNMISEFSALVMRDLLKRFGQTDAVNDAPITLNDAKMKLSYLQNSFDSIQTFCSKLKCSSANIQAKTKNIKKIISSVIANTSIVSENVTDQTVSTLWKQQQMKEIQLEIKPNIALISEFQMKCLDLEQRIKQKLTPVQIKFDPVNANKLFILLSDLYPEIKNDCDGIMVNHKIEFGRLLQCFQAAMPFILNQVALLPPVNLNELNTKSIQIKNVLSNVNDILAKANDFQIRRIHTVSSSKLPVAELQTKKELIKRSSLSVHLKTMILNTPPISHDIKKSETKPYKNMRISLLDYGERDIPPSATEKKQESNSVIEVRFQPISKQFCTPNRTQPVILNMDSKPSNNMEAIQMLKSIEFKKIQLRNPRRNSSLWDLQTSTPDCNPKFKNHSLSITSSVPHGRNQSRFFLENIPSSMKRKNIEIDSSSPKIKRMSLELPHAGDNSINESMKRPLNKNNVNMKRRG